MFQSSEISVASLRPYLATHLPELGELLSLEKFSTGQSNPTYKAKFTTRDCVIRSKPPGQLLKSAHQIDREFKVMTALSNSSVPVPRMLHLADDLVSPIGRSFFVMDFLDGRIFWDPAMPNTKFNERGLLYNEMADILADLHKVIPKQVGLEEFGRPGSYFFRQTSRWSEQYKQSASNINPDMVYLADWLFDNMPDDDGQISLVHGDYRLDNMIFSADEPKVIGLLDWELATLGHPFADVAYQCMQWRLPYHSGMRGLGGVERNDLGIPAESEYVSRYCERRSISFPDNWSFFLIFSYFKFAGILEGVVRRALDGNGSNPEIAKTYAAVIPIAVDQAMSLVKR
jgi:aminoglycoside phosphotransferase (APT) family kinase protein